MRFESAAFKLSHEMTQLLDPSGQRDSSQFHMFEELCVRGFLAVRLYVTLQSCSRMDNGQVHGAIKFVIAILMSLYHCPCLLYGPCLFANMQLRL